MARYADKDYVDKYLDTNEDGKISASEFFSGTLDEGRQAVSSFLKYLFTTPKLHQTMMYIGANYAGTNAITGIRRFQGLTQKLNDWVAVVGSYEEAFLENVMTAAANTTLGAVGQGTVNSYLQKALTEANSLLDEMKNPNIEGIPIHAEQEVESSDVKVSETLLINQDSAMKEYAVDNAAPGLRTWTLKGYLMSNGLKSNWTAGLLIKPDLIIQRKLLQWYADSRKPVMYKTHDNRFFSVLIQHFETAYTVQGTNALAVNITLKEFKALEVNSQSVAVNELASTGEKI